MGFTRIHCYKAGKTDWMAAGLPIEGAAAARTNAAKLAGTDVPRARIDEAVGEIRRRVSQSAWNCAVVVSQGSVVLGFLDARALDSGAGACAEEIMQADPLTVRPNLEPGDIREKLDDGAQHALVTDLDGKLIGLVRRSDLP